MALTKKQYNQLFGILNDIDRAVTYMQQPGVKGIAREITGDRANGADYRIINPGCVGTCSNVSEYIGISNKEIGSDIAGLYFAKSKLSEFIKNA